MGLDITLLKVRHEGKEEARKLFPYIDNCDVFCPEATLCSASWVETYEQEWLCQIMHIIPYTPPKFSDDFGSGEYIAEWYPYLYSKAKPVYLLERWNISYEASNALQLENHQLHERWKKVKIIDESNIQEWEEYIMRFEKITRMRDEHIGMQLNLAEQNLRRKHGFLREKKTISLCAYVGAAHCPEKYTSLPVKIVELTEPVVFKELIEIIK
jgi:hypothetical protein